MAGLLSFLSPCILPMVPFYLCYLTGLTLEDLRAGRNSPHVILSAMAFAAGVTTIFVLLGIGATTVGQLFLEWRDLLRFGAAAILLLLGLHMLGIWRLAALDQQRQSLHVSRPASLIGAYGIGLAFGFGWIPCVGPTLTAILFLAANGDSMLRGAGLLLVYGVAMTLPFVLVAALAGHASGWITRHRHLFRHVEQASGVMLILFALLIASDKLYLIADWLLRHVNWSGVLT
nr:cytochrome c biogenesis protein CcdA [Paracoccus amoyensis]